MKLSSRHTFLLLLAIVSLVTGVLNYLFFQPNIILFNIIKLPSFGNHRIQPIFIQLFLEGYFSDITWCVALCLITVILSELNYLRLNGKILIFTLPFLSETAQYFGFIGGTFDWYDVLTYAAIIFLFVLLFPTLKKLPNEKN